MTLYHTRGALASARRRPAGLLGQLVPAMVRLHLLQAEPEGDARAHLGRAGYDGGCAAGRATIASARSGSTSTPRRSSSTSTRRIHHTVANGSQTTLAIPVAATPVRVEISIPNAIPPSAADPRHLGAQVGFTFKPAEADRPAPGRDRADARAARAAAAPPGTSSRWEREEAAYPYFTARLGSRPGVVGPFAAAVFDGDTPRRRPRRADRGAPASLPPSATTSSTRPTVRAPPGRRRRDRDDPARGGDHARPDRRRKRSRPVMPRSRCCLPLEVGSSSPERSGRLAARSRGSRCIAPWTRRLLRLPGSFDEFLASRSHKTRKGIRRDASSSRPRSATGSPSRSCATLSTPNGSSSTPTGSRSSAYQRRLGVGFADSAEQRALVRVGLEHGWMRGYLLYLDGEPVAYWLCSPFRRRMLLRTGGYDEAYAGHRVGIYLLMRVIEDACADPALDVLDFGPGDASYKQQYANESREGTEPGPLRPHLPRPEDQRHPNGDPRARKDRQSRSRRDRAHRPRQDELATTRDVVNPPVRRRCQTSTPHVSANATDETSTAPPAPVTPHSLPSTTINGSITPSRRRGRSAGTPACRS